MKIVFITLIAFCFILCLSAQDQIAKKEQIKPVFLGDEKYQPSEPLLRGKERKPPGGILMAERNPIIWGWQFEPQRTMVYYLAGCQFEQMTHARKLK